MRSFTIEFIPPPPDVPDDAPENWLLTELLEALGGRWHRLGSEAACEQGSLLLSIDVALEDGGRSATILAWVRPFSRAHRPWVTVAMALVPLIGVNLLFARPWAPQDGVTLEAGLAIVAASSVLPAWRWRSQAAFERARPAAESSLDERVRTALARLPGIVAVREKPVGP